MRRAQIRIYSAGMNNQRYGTALVYCSPLARWGWPWHWRRTQDGMLETKAGTHTTCATWSLSDVGLWKIWLLMRLQYVWRLGKLEGELYICRYTTFFHVAGPHETAKSLAFDGRGIHRGSNRKKETPNGALEPAKILSFCDQACDGTAR